MNSNNDKKKYSAADIQRYLNGQMPAVEMNALERAAMDDPFLADAVEGFSHKATVSETGVMSDLDELRARLKKRTEDSSHKRIVPFYHAHWWKIAAVILILAGSGSLVYYLATNERTAKTIVAKNNAKEQTPDSPPAATSRILDTPVTVARQTEDRQGFARLQAKPGSLKKLQNPKPSQQATPPIMAASAPLEKKPGNLPAQNDTEDKRTITRQERSADSVAVSMAALNNKSAKREMKSARAFPPAPEAIPVHGTDSFNNYIEKNRQIQAPDSNLHGEVVVSFQVSRNGKLSKFNIEKSLSKQLDEEAIRLIKEGPSWKVLKNKKTKATVTIHF